MAFGVGIVLFVLAAVLIFAVQRSSIQSTWVLVGTVVVAAALMSIYAVANFVDSSHIPRAASDCARDGFPSSDWLRARRQKDRDDERLRDLARQMERCDVVLGDSGADVRARLGPPDRKAGDSSDRLWTYALGTRVSDPATVRIRFRGGRAVSAQTTSAR